MSPLYAIRPEAVAILDAADKPAILERLSEVFAKSWSLDAAEVLEQLEERERLGSTGFGRGVAIPHARIAGLSRPVAALLKLRHPADFAAADGLPVDLVFGLLSPENSGATHLHALAAISRLVRDERVHEALSEAPDTEALYGLLDQCRGPLRRLIPCQTRGKRGGGALPCARGALCLGPDQPAVRVAPRDPR
jgi:PTS system nitrogen regulatory IIA component